MWRSLQTSLRRLYVWLYRSSIKQALALHLRGEVRSGGLTANYVSSRLEIEWRARDIHPWDRYDDIYEREVMFVEQTLADTEAAVLRLFEKLPQVDIIEIKVLDPRSETVFASGTVHRSALAAVRPHLLSVKMRLGEMGIHYRFVVPERDYSTADPAMATLSLG
jgi:hypothetical protein